MSRAIHGVCPFNGNLHKAQEAGITLSDTLVKMAKVVD